MKTKECTKCGEVFEASLVFFISHRGHKDGLGSCRKCNKIACEKYYKLHKDKVDKANAIYRNEHKNDAKDYSIVYRKKNSEKIKENKKKYYQKNKDKILSYIHAYANKHKSQVLLKNKRYYASNKEKIENKAVIYRQKNKEKIRDRKKIYADLNKEKTCKYSKEYYQTHKKERNEYCRNKRKTDLGFKILLNLRTKLSRSVKYQNAKKLAHTVELVGCPIDKLIRHLELKFTNGMSWENYGKNGWHIDHIKPCIAFNLTELENQKNCFHYTNLQPLWWRDNLSKNSFYDGKLIRKGDKKWRL